MFVFHKERLRAQAALASLLFDARRQQVPTGRRIRHWLPGVQENIFSQTGRSFHQSGFMFRQVA